MALRAKNQINLSQLDDTISQYFWTKQTAPEAGAHITEIPEDEFLADPDNGGYNAYMTSRGFSVRDGTTENAIFGPDTIIKGGSVSVYDNNDTLGFLVETGTDTGDVEVKKDIADFRSIASGANKTYTLTETPVTGKSIKVQLYNYTFNPQPVVFTFTAGTSSSVTKTGNPNTNTIKVEYTAPGTFKVTNNTSEDIYYGYIVFYENRANAKVTIPASLTIQTEDFTKALFDPVLSSTGLSVYISRLNDYTGGIFKLGKWCYVDIQIEIGTSLSANNNWAVMEGYPVPKNYYSALTVAIFSSSQTCRDVGAYVNGNGRLCVATHGQALAVANELAITGWYMTI